MWLNSAFIMGSFVLLGCGVATPEPLGDQRTMPPLPTLKTKQLCAYNSDTGCIAGQIVVAPQVYLEDEEYFDAEDMGRGLKSLLHFRDSEGNAIDVSHYGIDITPHISNETFAKDFWIYLKGNDATNYHIKSGEMFKFNKLREGVYTIRAQKRFQITVKDVPGQVSAPPLRSNTPSIEQEGEPSEKDLQGDNELPRDDKEPSSEKSLSVQERVFCINIYSEEKRLELATGKAEYMTFERFYLQMRDAECERRDRSAYLTISSRS